MEVVMVEYQQGVKSTKAAANVMVLLERQKREAMSRKKIAHNASVVTRHESNNIASTVFAFCSSPRFMVVFVAFSEEETLSHFGGDKIWI
jgi:hypothetical protein